ncbi:protein bicaudal D homolog 2 isoform X1 [Strongylocentrotus purpuratus]|uniref:Protein bicaudal D n=1 Tax=Strongylocentrotus purpuratus TaxID=7668 RepID=A0A7M7N1W0_STRPU|nr:protein bicaudal D homolog 2 isoform X1 [Strongylocentrotus purpuratus]XP_030828895.1 protein bicaudal D homolog 2 isoform X1 [Strongylocentrotus purpuratus]
MQSNTFAMFDSDDGSETIEELRVEIGRLKEELALASKEKIQAAEYGLGVLEEKQSIKQQYEDLDLLYETSKQELQMAKEALESKAQWQRRYSEQEVNHEQSLLQESATREADLTERLAELETEGRHMRQEVSRLRVEKERLYSRHTEMNTSLEQSDKERKEVKEELREIKFREKRLLRDYSELEEENIAMQKQNSSLKSSQIEYESFKHENRRLAEEIQYLNSNIEDLMRLRDISEKQIEETMQALECERDQKHQLKKQLDQAMISELEAINVDLENNSQFHYMEEDYEDEECVGHPLLRRYERQMRDDNGGEEETNIGQEASDLFSELQSMEVQNLEKQLKQVESEKSELSKHLEKSNSELETTRDALSSLSDLNISPTEGEIDHSQYQHLDEAHQKLYQLVSLYKIQEKKYAGVLSKNKDLQSELEALRSKVSDAGAKVELQKEVQLMTDRNRKQQDTIRDLQGQLKGIHDMVGDAHGQLNLTQDELAKVSEDIAQLYHHVCMVNGEAPNRIMQDHLKVTRQSRRDGFRAEIANQLKEVSNENGQEKSGDGLGAASPSGSPSKRSNEHAKFNGDTVTCTTLVSTVRDQIKYLKRSVEQSVEMSRQHGTEGSGAENEDLRDEVVQLKGLLMTKREQVVTLRTVLKANKTTAEVALANLKSKYEHEKAIIAETMKKLRNELKALKEEAASFASLRAMFAKRCDEYVTQLDDMHRQLSSAEEEKKTLNSLLRMAIQQKLALTQRLEDLEFQNEMSSNRRGPRKHKSSKVSDNQMAWVTSMGLPIPHHHMGPIRHMGPPLVQVPFRSMRPPPPPPPPHHQHLPMRMPRFPYSNQPHFL